MADARLSEVEAGRAGPGPAVQDQRPLPVVGKAVTLAQFPQLGDGVAEPRQVAAHLMRDAAVRERHRQAVRVAGRPGQADGAVAAGLGVVVLAEQPVGVRGEGLAVDVGPGAGAQRGGAVGQPDGELEVAQRLGGPAQGDGRAADREMAGPLGSEPGSASASARLAVWYPSTARP